MRSPWKLSKELKEERVGHQRRTHTWKFKEKTFINWKKWGEEWREKARKEEKAKKECIRNSNFFKNFLSTDSKKKVNIPNPKLWT